MAISTTKDFTRGGQITLHGLRMFAQIANTFFKVMLVTWGLLVGYIWHTNTTELTRYYTLKWSEAQLHVSMLNRNATITFRESGEPYIMSSGDIVDNIVLNQHLAIAKAAAMRAAIITSAICLLFSLAIIFWFIRKGKTQLEDSHLRGSSRCTPDELKQKLAKAKEASNITLAGTPIANNAEVQHFLITGTTGSGKTVCMHELLQQVRNNGQRAIVYDIEGAFIPTYYREGVDQILNPIDSRSPVWNIWQEGDIMAHFDNIAESLMPLHLAGTDPFWINAARTIFSATAFKLKQSGQCHTHILLKHLFSADLSEIRKILKGTAAEAMVAIDMEKTALSIKATLSTYCKSLLYLKDDSKGADFSIRDWVQNDTGDSWLFISSNQSLHAALRPLITLIIDTAINSLLAMKPDFDRRLWFFIDEMSSLNQLPSLFDAAERGRKKGLCLSLGLQSVNQLAAIYGQHKTNTLVSLCNTKLCFKTKDHNSAAWASSLFGNAEILETKEGLSYGAHEMRDGVSLQEQKLTRSVVLPSEIMQLPNLSAFMQCGSWPVTNLEFTYKEQDKHCNALELRDLSKINMIGDPPPVETQDTPDTYKVPIDL